MTPRLLILALALASGPAAAAEVQVLTGAAPQSSGTEHGKASTGDASPVDPGALETELAYAPLWSGGAFGSGATGASTQAWSVTATYGLVRDVDVVVSGAFAAVYDGTRPGGAMAPRTGTGLGDLVAGARWRFLDAPERELEVAVAVSAVLPVGDHGSTTDLATSQGYWSGRAALVATKDVGRFTTNVELACTVPIAGDAHGLVGQGQANLAVGYQVLRWFQPELELNYQASLGPTAQVLAVTAGVVVPWGSGQRVVAAVQQSVATWNAAPITGAVVAYKRAL